MKNNILHIISGLGNGGAEGVLYRLCISTVENYNHKVISLTTNGKYGSLLQKNGIEVIELGLNKNFFQNIKRIIFLYQIIKNSSPNIIQTWMYHADLIGGILGRIAGIKNIYWNIRHTNLDKKKSKLTTRLISKICSILSYYLPKKIICCAVSSQKIHEKIGYDKSKFFIIPNGYDLNIYKSFVANTKLIEKYNINKNIPILGMVGRYDSQKNHTGLLRSLYLIKNEGIEFKFLLVGKDINLNNKLLNKEINSLNLENNIILLDQQNNIANIMNMLDIHVLSSSFGEAFPNVIAEAMACTTPCISTNVGDAALIISDTGWVTPPMNDIELAHAIKDAIFQFKNNKELWENRKKRCREHILYNFSINKMILNYYKVWGDK